MSLAVKKNRIDLRVNNNDKELLEKAAQISGLSLSSYVLSAILKQAHLDLIQNETLVLANKDRDLLLSALDSPSKPNSALAKLFNK